MISSIHFPDQTHAKLLDLIEDKKSKGLKYSKSRLVTQLIEKEHDLINPHGKEKKAIHHNGVQEQPVQTDGEQDDQPEAEDQQTFEG